MKHTEFSWLTEDGVSIFAQLWAPESSKAVVCLVHGLGEHSSRYKLLPCMLVEAGYALMAFDLRGHGKSGGKRGHTPSYGHLMDDIRVFLAHVQERFPGLPVYLYGHSMGGNLVLNYVLRHNPGIHGVIATGPWLKLTHPPKEFLVRCAAVMDRVWPAFQMRNGIKPVDLSHDESVKIQTEKDELMHPWITLRTFMSVSKAAGYALENARNFPCRLLLMHGGSDNVTLPEGSRQFASHLNGSCSLKIWDGLYHEIHNEPRSKEIFGYLLSWLQCDNL